MKKSLLFCLGALLLCNSAEARKWDFSNWSQATIAQVKAAADWTNDEKGDNTTNVVPDDACVWNTGASASAACDENGNLMAGGSVIAELEGLKWTATAAKKIAIAFDYKVTTDANKWGPYNGPAYLWLNGKTTAVHFTIPAVKPGTTIKMGIESHNPTNARGIDLYVNNTKLTKDPADYPTAYADYTWVIPENPEVETVDVDVQPSNGCHIYYIDVQEGEGEVKTYSIAYLYDGTYNGAKDADKNPIGYKANGGLESDPVYATLNDNFTVDTLNFSALTMTPAELNDSLTKYDAVVLSEAVSSGNAYAKAMVEIINKVPMVNFKSFMYKSGVWSVGGGKNPSPRATSITFKEDLLEGDLLQSLLKDIDLESAEMQIFKSDEVAGGNLVQGYTVSTGSLFESDEVLATVSSINAIHTHGGKRNMYMLLPFSCDNLSLDGDWNITDDALTLVVNAVRTVAATKSKVTPAAAPAIAEENGNNTTTVTLTCSTKDAVIYYTLDGTDPTEKSTVYAEPFAVTTDSILVKAFATAHGYEASAIAEKYIRVKGQAAAPEINVEMADGKTVVTLTAAEGINIYYSFNGIKTAAGSAVYDDQVGIELTEPATITYFAANDKLLASDIQTYDVCVTGIPAVKDTVAHFTANEADWFTNAIILDYQKETLETPSANWAAKAAYYFGKSAWSYYSTTEVDSIVTVKDDEGNVLKCIDGETDSTKTYYKPEPTAVKYVASATDKQWVLRTQGQILTGETNVAPLYEVGTGLANYYAQSAYDLIGQPSKGKLTFGGKGSNEPYSAGVESTEKFQAPFDVVTYTTNGGGNPYVIALQTSADGETWTSVDTLSCASAQRYYVKDRMHVDGTDQLYVRLLQVGGSSKAQLYDIYVITTDGVSGIEVIKDNANPVANLNSIFDLQGRKVVKAVAGRLYIQNGKKVIVK